MQAQKGWDCRTRRTISIPSRPGRFLSVSKQPKPSRSSRANASSALLAVRMEMPFSPSTRWKRSSTTGSSSTTSTEEGKAVACILEI